MRTESTLNSCGRKGQNFGILDRTSVRICMGPEGSLPGNADADDLGGWWKALFEHSGDVPSVLRVDKDMEETLGVEGLSNFVRSLGFDPNPVYLPLDRDEYLVDIAAATRDL